MKKNNEKFIKELEKTNIEDAQQFLEKNILPIMKKDKVNLYQALQKYRSSNENDGDRFLLHIALIEIGDAKTRDILL